MLEIRNFRKKYGDRLIVSADALGFSAGINWIRGENGSGKSSLFRALAGIIPCEGDAVFNDGVSLKRSPNDYRLRVNFSDAEPLFPSFLTGNEIFRFIARAKKASLPQQTDLIDCFGLTFLNQQCGTYSSGMAKRLSLSVAFLGSPYAVILDEPLITLDAVMRQALLDRITRLISNNDVSVLISSHEDLSGSGLPLAQTLSIRDRKLVRN